MADQQLGLRGHESVCVPNLPMNALQRPILSGMKRRVLHHGASNNHWWTHPSPTCRARTSSGARRSWHGRGCRPRSATWCALPWSTEPSRHHAAAKKNQRGFVQHRDGLCGCRHILATNRRPRRRFGAKTRRAKTHDAMHKPIRSRVSWCLWQNPQKRGRVSGASRGQLGDGEGHMLFVPRHTQHPPHRWRQKCARQRCTGGHRTCHSNQEAPAPSVATRTAQLGGPQDQASGERVRCIQHMHDRVMFVSVLYLLKVASQSEKMREDRLELQCQGCTTALLRFMAS